MNACFCLSVLTVRTDEWLDGLATAPLLSKLTPRNQNHRSPNDSLGIRSVLQLEREERNTELGTARCTDFSSRRVYPIFKLGYNELCGPEENARLIYLSLLEMNRMCLMFLAGMSGFRHSTHLLTETRRHLKSLNHSESSSCVASLSVCFVRNGTYRHVARFWLQASIFQAWLSCV